MGSLLQVIGEIFFIGGGGIALLVELAQKITVNRSAARVVRDQPQHQKHDFATHEQ